MSAGPPITRNHEVRVLELVSQMEDRMGESVYALCETRFHPNLALLQHYRTPSLVIRRVRPIQSGLLV